MNEDTFYGEVQGNPTMGAAAPVSTAATSRKRFPIVAIIAGIVILAVAAILIFGGKLSFGGSKAEPTTISAKMDEDGMAYIPLLDGDCIKINDEVLAATISKDRKHVVVALNDGTLYVTDKSLGSKTQVSTECARLSSVKNDGFFYWDTEDNVHRVLFADFSDVTLGHDVAFLSAANNTSVLYATDEGGIYTLSSTSEESNKVGSYTSSIELEAISDDAEISVWVTSKDNVQTIVLNDGDERETLGEVDYKYNYTYVNTTDDQGVWIITNLYSNYIWIKYPGQETVKGKLGADCYSSRVYGDSGLITDMKASDVKTVYLSSDADTGCNLYAINTDGDRERLLSKISAYRIFDGKILYTDLENNLYIAELSDSEVSDENKIASDVDSFEVSHNGKYVYYMRNCEEDVGALYCYKVGSSEPEKVASEAACSSYGSMYITISSDGSSVFFFKDMEKIPDTYTYQGTLMLWTYGSKDGASKISSDVVNYSVSSGLSTSEANVKSFVFMKYNSVNSDGDILVNWMYSNGSDVTKMASDIIR